ncbi:uncharacterized protein LOC125377279 [Haliotis rufescens]|uniref:uncharacterized protein LOC125377279 n=1 Tax=Haliotis rufescens TaxID=6454 RepID=UPI00201EF8F1|nr:uncharacterized protein LOC125377279 [Haliotis rufescens]
MECDLIQIGAICNNFEKTCDFMKENNLIASTMNCDKCNMSMSWQKDKKNKSDGHVWRCTKCRKCKSVRFGSFWEGQKASLGTLLMILYLFCNDVPGHITVKMLSVCENTVYSWYNLYRDLMSRSLLDDPVVLGGVGHVVEMDESKWGRKRKYNMGSSQGIRNFWIFGLIDRQSKKVLLFNVHDRTTDTLLPIIIAHVEVGTQIITDEFKSYICLQKAGYAHDTVKHKDGYVNPKTGAHTNSIEGFWGNAKAKFKSMHGVPREQLAAHLDEIMFRWNNKNECMFTLMLGLMNKYYKFV